MPLRFLPLGTIVSSSQAVSASMTDASKLVPTTASLAGHALNLQGPTGSAFMVMSASRTVAPPYGLVISS